MVTTTIPPTPLSKVIQYSNEDSVVKDYTAKHITEEPLVKDYSLREAATSHNPTTILTSPTAHITINPAASTSHTTLMTPATTHTTLMAPVTTHITLNPSAVVTAPVINPATSTTTAQVTTTPVIRTFSLEELAQFNKEIAMREFSQAQSFLAKEITVREIVADSHLTLEELTTPPHPDTRETEQQQQQQKQQQQQQSLQQQQHQQPLQQQNIPLTISVIREVNR